MKIPMIFRQAIATVAVAGMTFSSTVGAALATESAAQSDKVTICHRTESAKNPYVVITINRDALPAHEKHGDFPAGNAGCQIPVPPDTGPIVLCVVSDGVTQIGNTVTGTIGDDTIDCTNASPGKTIIGGDGNDTITGTAFNDVITGGDGNDTVTGGPGDDTIDAGNGNDTVTGGPGNDTIEGGNGNDTLTGGDGDDTVTDIGDGEDTITP
jgi:hypothetical protein